MYLGLIGIGVWIAIVLLRYQKGLEVLDWSAVPRGYRLAFAALPLAAIAGPLDFIWHEAYGFENQIDSTFSPPHQGLFYAGAMLAAIPAASAWQRRWSAPPLRCFWPVVFSVTSVIAAMLFVVHQLLPFYGGAGVVATEGFQDDIAGRADAFSPGADAVHTEGLSQALTHYGDDAFPFYFFSVHTAVAGILLFTIAFMGAILLMRRRWQIPAGSLTIMGTFLALLWPMLSEYREAELIPALVLAGVVGDLLLARFGEHPHPPLRAAPAAGAVGDLLPLRRVPPGRARLGADAVGRPARHHRRPRLRDVAARLPALQHRRKGHGLMAEKRKLKTASTTWRRKIESHETFSHDSIDSLGYDWERIGNPKIEPKFPFKVYLPRKTEDVAEAVKECKKLGQELRIRSKGHSSNDLVLNPGGAVMLMQGMDEILDVDQENLHGHRPGRRHQRADR